MFDINGDGNLDGFERTMQMDFIDYFNHDGIYKESLSDDNLDIDDFDSDFGDFDRFSGDEF